MYIHDTYKLNIISWLYMYITNMEIADAVRSKNYDANWK